jgi:hypothetical protein
VHPRVGRVQLTPRITHLLTQLRGARSFARYVATRLEHAARTRRVRYLTPASARPSPCQERGYGHLRTLV